MKKIYFVVLFAMFLILSKNADSVPISCRNDCYDSIPYVHDVMFVPIPGCPPCTVRVDFLHRYGICDDSNEVKDLYVVGFDYKVGDCPCLQNKNDWERWDSVLIHFVKRFYWTDDEDDGIDPITLKYPPCAKTSRYFNEGSKFREGKYCYEDTSCCIHVLKLVRQYDNEGNRKPNFIQSDIIVQEYEGTCPVDTVINGDTIRCTNICNPLVNPFDPWPPGTPIYLSSGEKDYSATTTNDYYIISNELILPINSYFKNESIKVRIYNNLGAVVYEAEVSAFDNHLILNLSTLMNGLYTVQLFDKQNVLAKDIIHLLVIK